MGLLDLFKKKEKRTSIGPLAGIKLENQNGVVVDFTKSQLQHYLNIMYEDMNQFVTVTVPIVVNRVRYLQACVAGNQINIQAGIEEYNQITLVEKYCSKEECNHIFSDFYDYSEVDGLENYTLLSVNSNEALGNANVYDNYNKPLQYERGYIIGSEYISHCLGYKFVLPEGCTVLSEDPTTDCESFNQIVDFGINLPNGSKVSVLVQQFTESEPMPPINDEIIVAMQNQIAEDRKRAGVEAEFIGIEKLIGRRFAHNRQVINTNGVVVNVEEYTYYTQYYMLNFLFWYTNGYDHEYRLLKDSIHIL